MTLFFCSPRRLMTAIGLALACAVPIAYAAELEGTPVPVEGSANNVQVETPAPVPPISPDAETPEQAPQPPKADDHHRNWERDWEKNLSEAFAGDRRNTGGNDGPNAMEALIVLFAVIALIIVLCSPLILVGVFLVLRHKAKARHQQALNNNIDKLLAAGRDIPLELLRGDEPKSADQTGNLANGIRNICLGAGWLVFLTIAFDIEVGAIGFIWIGLGLSQVLIWYLNKPTVTEQAGQQD